MKIYTRIHKINRAKSKEAFTKNNPDCWKTNKEFVETPEKEITDAQRRHNIYFHGTEEEKEKAFAHFSTTGYGIFAMVIMAIGFGLGIMIGGLFGWIIASTIMGWILFKFPTTMHMWENFEKHNPDIKKYRIDKFK